MHDERSKLSEALIKTLQSERKARGLSHEKLAELASISRQAIGKIENGERNPTIQTVYRIAKAMDMTLEQFVKKMNLG
jgi:transcriptional regulator with XRE-family HTH domain